MPDQVAALELVRLREGIGRLADSWSDEDEGIEHVASCQNYTCPMCAVVACATDLRALLDHNEGER